MRKITATQEEQLKTVKEQASNLIAQQEEMAQNLVEQKNQYALAIEQVKTAQEEAAEAIAKAQAKMGSKSSFADTLDELESDFNSVDEAEAIEKIKNWIESA